MKNRLRERRSLRCVALLETTLSLLAFLTIIYGVIKFGYLMYAKQTLNHAVREGGRIATTGRILYPEDRLSYQTNWPSYVYTNVNNGEVLNVLSDYNDSTRPMSRQQAIVEIIKRNLITLTNATNAANLSIVNWQVTNDSTATPTYTEASPQIGPGERSDENFYRYVRIRIDYPVSILGGATSITLRAETIVINDAWGFTNKDLWP